MTVTVTMSEAKAHLSRLVDQAVRAGEDFIIAKGGKPLVKVSALVPRADTPRTLGFLKGRGTIPNDIKAGFEREIDAMFGLK